MDIQSTEKMYPIYGFYKDKDGNFLEPFAGYIPESTVQQLTESGATFLDNDIFSDKAIRRSNRDAYMSGNGYWDVYSKSNNWRKMHGYPLKRKNGKKYKEYHNPRLYTINFLGDDE